MTPNPLPVPPQSLPPQQKKSSTATIVIILVMVALGLLLELLLRSLDRIGELTTAREKDEQQHGREGEQASPSPCLRSHLRSSPPTAHRSRARPPKQSRNANPGPAGAQTFRRNRDAGGV